jgi:hypothetical protein
VVSEHQREEKGETQKTSALNFGYFSVPSDFLLYVEIIGFTMTEANENNFIHFLKIAKNQKIILIEYLCLIITFQFLLQK